MNLSLPFVLCRRHNALLTGGFYTILSFAMPFNPPFPTMGACARHSTLAAHDHAAPFAMRSASPADLRCPSLLFPFICWQPPKLFQCSCSATLAQLPLLRCVLCCTLGFNPAPCRCRAAGLCPGGYEGTWVCETNRAKAFDMYKEWKETGKWKPAKAAAPAADKH